MASGNIFPHPTLLEFPGPRLLAYPRGTVVAEKLEGLVKLGVANTRMKDFYDLEVLSRTFASEGKILAQAIQNTFQKRETDPPMAGVPVAFTTRAWILTALGGFCGDFNIDNGLLLSFLCKLSDLLSDKFSGLSMQAR